MLVFSGAMEIRVEHCSRTKEDTGGLERQLCHAYNGVNVVDLELTDGRAFDALLFGALDGLWLPLCSYLRRCRVN